MTLCFTRVVIVSSIYTTNWIELFSTNTTVWAWTFFFTFQWDLNGKQTSLKESRFHHGDFQKIIRLDLFNALCPFSRNNFSCYLVLFKLPFFFVNHVHIFFNFNFLKMINVNNFLVKGFCLKQSNTIPWGYVSCNKKFGHNLFHHFINNRLYTETDKQQIHMY